jgi:hypothetical protein
MTAIPLSHGERGGVRGMFVSQKRRRPMKKIKIINGMKGCLMLALLAVLGLIWAGGFHRQ